MQVKTMASSLIKENSAHAKYVKLYWTDKCPNWKLRSHNEFSELRDEFLRRSMSFEQIFQRKNPLGASVFSKHWNKSQPTDRYELHRVRF